MDPTAITWIIAFVIVAVAIWAAYKFIFKPQDEVTEYPQVKCWPDWDAFDALIAEDPTRVLIWDYENCIWIDDPDADNPDSNGTDDGDVEPTEPEEPAPEEPTEPEPEPEVQPEPEPVDTTPVVEIPAEALVAIPVEVEPAKEVVQISGNATPVARKPRAKQAKTKK